MVIFTTSSFFPERAVYRLQSGLGGDVGLQGDVPLAEVRRTAHHPGLLPGPPQGRHQDAHQDGENLWGSLHGGGLWLDQARRR